eukprot:6969850-Heterocapsa_arctica.AAC.1
MAGNQIAEVQMRCSVCFDRGGEKGLAVPGRALELASERCARGAIKRVRRLRRGGTRRQMMKA